MSADLYKKYEDEIFQTCFIIADLHKTEKINSITLAMMCAKLIRIFDAKDETALRDLVYRKGALDQLIFQITRMPAPKQR